MLGVGDVEPEADLPRLQPISLSIRHRLHLVCSLAKKLIERLEEPRVESARLSGLRDCYKIKLRSAGYRLVYQVRDAEIVVSVVAVGKRERNAVYKAAVKRV